MELCSYPLFALFSLILVAITFEFQFADGKRTSKKIKNTDEGLFDNGDKVAIINGREEYSRVVYNKDIAFVVLFYNHWCGHCVRFAPVYKQFASDVYEWREFVQVAAVDCAEEINTDLCGSKKIEGYPTLMFQPPLSNAATVATKIDSFHSLDLLRNSTASYINSLVDSIPKYQVLKPIQSLNELDREKTSEIQHTFVVVTNRQTSNIGTQVKLDLHQQKDILIHHIDIQNLANTNIHAMPPALLYSDSNGKLQVIQQQVVQPQDIVIEISRITQRKRRQHEVVQPEQKKSIIYRPKERPRSVNLVDLESSLTYILTKEVAMTSLIEDEKLAALKEFVHVLLKYFPARPNKAMFLQNVSSWLDTITTSIKGRKWASKIQLLQTENKLPEITWIGCAGSLSRYRGYPCSLWMLFHSLTVQAYNSPVTDTSPPYKVLLAIRNYVKYFFGCAECRENFLNASSHIESQVKTRSDAVLWLWNMHNSVNLRLRGDITEDPRYPKLPFPYIDYCKKCHVKNSDDNYIYDEENVLEFLSVYYNKINMVSTRSQSYPYGDTKSLDLDWFGVLNYHREKNKRIINITMKPRALNMAKRSQKDDSEQNLVGNSEQNVYDNNEDSEQKVVEMNDRFKKSLEQNDDSRQMENLAVSNVSDKSATKKGARIFGLNFSRSDVGLCFVLWAFSMSICLCVFLKLKYKRSRFKRLLPF